MLADLRDSRIAFGFFTFVAATDVLGTALVGRGAYPVALGLLAVGGVSWIALGYVVPWSAVLGRSANRPVMQNANGTWFIWVVEPVGSGARRDPETADRWRWWRCCPGRWVVPVRGGRDLRRGQDVGLLAEPSGSDPALLRDHGRHRDRGGGGARIVQMADAPMVAATRGLAAGVSVAFWAFGTWLIPVLLAVGVWRHLVHRTPFNYSAPLWSGCSRWACTAWEPGPGTRLTSTITIRSTH
jgi:hypothetical protein